MLKVVTFADSACGGIMCAMLNQRDLSLDQNNHVREPSHYYLRSSQSKTTFDKESYLRLKNDLSDLERTWFLGTNWHPSQLLWDNDIHKFVYIRVRKPESIAVILIRSKSIELYPAELKLSTGALLFTSEVNDPLVDEHELFDVVKDEQAMERFVNYYNVPFDKSKFKTWYDKNIDLERINLVAKQYEDALDMHRN